MRIVSTASRTLLWLAAAGLSACTTYPYANDRAAERGYNPYSPWYSSENRHGALPTRETMAKMRDWQTSMLNAHKVAAASKTLQFSGGIDSIGVTSGVPRVYLVFYGSQWAASGGDPKNAATFLQALFSGIGTKGETWSGTMTQYCDGPMVGAGATSCNPATMPHVGYPSGGALAGVWYDTSVASPGNATATQLAQEAVKASSHFGNTTPAANRYVQYVIVSPTGTHPDGFNTSGSNFCAWHDFMTSSNGDVAYTNLPYVSDAGTNCGANFVNSGKAGALDGLSIVAGHEYAETLTDQNPPGGWTNPGTEEENGDECAWISSGQGRAANVIMATGTFAMQSTWSNDTNRCEISHPIMGNPQLVSRNGTGSITDVVYRGRRTPRLH
jgi:serine protease